MQLGEGESLWPVLAAVKWVRTYHAAAATPLEPDDILFGKLAWVVTRCFATSSGLHHRHRSIRRVRNPGGA